MKRLLLGAGVLVLALSACGGSGRSGIISPVRTLRVRTLPALVAERIAASTPELRLAIAVPRGLVRYDIRGGGHEAGKRPSGIGVLATDDRRKYRSGSAWAEWSRLSSSGPPANRVAFRISQWLPNRQPTLLRRSALRLHLPLSLHQPWFQQHLTNGSNGYRWGYLRVHGQFYEAFFWSGRAAPAKDRAAVLSALASVHPRR